MSSLFSNFDFLKIPFFNVYYCDTMCNNKQYDRLQGNCNPFPGSLRLSLFFYWESSVIAFFYLLLFVNCNKYLQLSNKKCLYGNPLVCDVYILLVILLKDFLVWYVKLEVNCWIFKVVWEVFRGAKNWNLIKI